MKGLLVLLVVLLGLAFTSCTSRTTDVAKILYVPLDERPVNLDYAAEIVNATPAKLLIPPARYLPSKKHPGTTEKLWQWVLDNGKEADYIVLSADTMLYGGLTPSRLHNIGRDELTAPLANFGRIKQLNPSVKLYVFSTVMRAPQENTDTAEPDYYGFYGSRIFKITALRNKAEVEGLSVVENEQLEQLLSTVPSAVIDDWLERRAKNFHVNTQLIEKNRKGIIDYFIICRDDTAVYSQSSKEYRSLSEMAVGLPADKFISFCGADEVGLILLTRAINRHTGTPPAVYVRFAPGVGGKVIPRYEDQEVWKNIERQITAAMCRPAASPAESDLILAVNTPEDGVTKEAGLPVNVVKNSPAVDSFVEAIREDIRSGRAVAVADIAFSNGADNTLMASLSSKKLLTEITSYAGWNTAANTLGYALCQGVLAQHMSEAEAARILAVRLLDDWGYQANVRKDVHRDIISSLNINKNELGSAERKIKGEVSARLSAFAATNLANFNIGTVKVAFPWNRTFDIHLKIEP